MQTSNNDFRVGLLAGVMGSFNSALGGFTRFVQAVWKKVFRLGGTNSAARRLKGTQGTRSRQADPNPHTNPLGTWVLCIQRSI